VSYGDPPPPPPPPSYGAPGAPVPGAASGRSGMALAGFILGIIGVIPCFWGCLVIQILAIVFGQLGKRDIAQSGGLKTNAGQARWAVILGIIGLVGCAIYYALYIGGTINYNFSSD
jgi:hypothetical protein